MLNLIIPSQEMFDENTSEFIILKEERIKLEHSLIAISRWESKYKKPFLHNDKVTNVELMDYISCMNIESRSIDKIVRERLSYKEINSITEYIGDPMTATTIEELTKNTSTKIVTSELIYGWMVVLQIPFDCEKWHLNRLTTLIRVCNELNTPPKQRSKADIMKRHKAINAARRAKYYNK